MTGMIITVACRHPKKCPCAAIFRVKKYFDGNKHFILKLIHECRAKESKIEEVRYIKQLMNMCVQCMV